MNNNFGLPLEYQKIPQYFDAHNISDDSNQKNAVIAKLLRQEKVKSVLDLTCGTGSQMFFLKKLGYDVTGADFSPELLKIARQKAKKEEINVKFIDGDMRFIKIGKFDAVITIFNAIGHLTKADFLIALQNIKENLCEKGIYVFDIFNLTALNEDVIQTFKMNYKKQIAGNLIHHIQHSKINYENGILTSYDSYKIKNPAGKIEKLKNSFKLQIYQQDELNEILQKNGFKILGQYDIKGNEFDKDKSLNILTICTKHNN